MKLRILGIRGVPAAHGGFETFAEHLSLYLTAKGWQVTVYCQVEGEREWLEDQWHGVNRVHIPVSQRGPLGTIVFDLKSTLHAARAGEPCLVLGYNTAVFVSLLRLRGIPSIINMDGIEWARAKWGRIAKAWFWLNDWAGCWLGTKLIADHPEIKRHLATRTLESKIVTIPYGAELVEGAPEDAIGKYGLEAGRFLTVIARPEPENSLLEIVQGFSKRTRGVKLAVLGKYEKGHPYQEAVLKAASDEVAFLGPIYDKNIVQALRFYSLAYVHGHQVGGTNPSLVEALGAGNAVIAHDNKFNRWVAGNSGVYFTSSDSFSDVLDKLLSGKIDVDSLRRNSRERFNSQFTWDEVLRSYEQLLLASC